MQTFGRRSLHQACIEIRTGGQQHRPTLSGPSSAFFDRINKWLSFAVYNRAVAGMLGGVVCKYSALLFLLALPLGCEAPQTNAPLPTAAPSASPTQAHALLFDLLNDEKNVSKLLIIKRERAELRTLINEISERAGKAYKELETFAKSDHTLNLKNTGLPSAEVFTRKAIAKTRAKELLTQSGKEFEVRLLLIQNEALTYGAHLATITANSDTAPDRRQMLQQLSADLFQLQKRTVEIVSTNYNAPAH